MSDLKPCPFCNCNLDDDQYSTCEAAGTYAVYCHGCESNGPFAESLDRAKEKWNWRHIPEGRTLVPIKPTEAMKCVMELVVDRHEMSLEEMYKAMLEAAKED